MKCVLLVVVVLFVALPTRADWFDSCDRQFQLTNIADVTLNSPFFPSNYPAGSSCRFVIRAPPGYTIQASCTLNMGTTSGCTTEFLYISTEGFTSPVGSEYFCGKGTVSRQSLFNKLTISYISASSTSSGSFTCRLVVQPQACDCGWSKLPKVVGGSEASINEFSSMVGLLDPLTVNVFCGGVIISSRYVLTAAHCTQTIPGVSRVQALVGDHDYRTGLETPYSAIYNIEQIITHESYNEQNRDNDISILKTTAEIDFNRAVGPVCLPFLYNSYDFGSLLIDVVGWGTTSFGGPMSTVLRKATLNVVPSGTCNAPYINGQKICTFTAGRDSCQYDSGGPLYLRGSQRVYTIGIISYGSACGAASPSVGTRITSYLNWIRQKTPEVSYCVK
ncbi:venom serine protease-like [Anopheles ziemanni]|uniref:venom serine protease-like n=1 Tax=Anopheles coustani TaxID=139045 RepID=UPI00265AB713|nr:venom serine protease-like [Anopheles coustani]XP_058170768.1 venom serine protease-like [Anopheles ziemanni]